MNRASVFVRFVALLIDLLIVMFFSCMLFVAALAGYRTGSGQLTFLGLSGILLLCPVFSLLVFLFYFTYLTMEQGMTIGKSILGIRVVRWNREDVRGLGFFRSLVRAAAYVLSASVCFMGFFAAIFLKGVTLHDIIAGTQVVTVCEGGDHEN